MRAESSSRRVIRWRFPERCHPFLESLKPRLPPGDTLLGALLGWSLVGELGAPLVIDSSFRVTSVPVKPKMEPNDPVAGAEQRETPAEAPTPSRIHRDVEDSDPATDQSLNQQAINQRAAGFNPAAHRAVAELIALSAFPISRSGTPVRETPFRYPSRYETEFPGSAFPNRSSGTRAKDFSADKPATTKAYDRKAQKLPKSQRIARPVLARNHLLTYRGPCSTGR